MKIRMPGCKGGGIPTRWIVLGFLGVLVILGTYVIYTKGYEMSGDLFGFWDDFFGGGGNGDDEEPPSKLEEAIKCAYYRCIESCSYAVNNVEVVDDFNCLDYCDPQETDTETMAGKICDDNARNYPVIVTLETDTIVKKFEPFNILMTSPDCSSTAAQYVGQPHVEQIDIDQRRIVQGQCPFGDGTYDIVQPSDGEIKCKIQAGTYFLWNHKFWSIGGEYIGNDVVICSGYGI